VLRFFSEHALVDEVFADEAEIRDALRSERSWSRGERRSEGLRGVWCCFLPPHAQGVGRPSSLPSRTCAGATTRVPVGRQWPSARPPPGKPGALAGPKLP
jgi:hypothetical protein